MLTTNKKTTKPFYIMSITSGNDLIGLADFIGLDIPRIATLESLDADDDYDNILINHDFHWTALLLRGKNAYYNNSFGLEPPKQVIEFVQKKGCNMFQFGSKQIQSVTSEDCGWFAVHFMSFMDRHRNFMWYFNQFPSRKLEDNDNVLEKYFDKLIEQRNLYHEQHGY